MDLAELPTVERPRVLSPEEATAMVGTKADPLDPNVTTPQLVVDADTRELVAAAHLARWIEAWARLWPEVPVVEVESPVQGWRPSAGPDDTGRYEAGSVPPLGHSGVRWAPSIIEAAVKELSA